ncbi:hypothetical protein PFISCL1PPCAC_9398, partial [Pristionchus fissidentatus]
GAYDSDEELFRDSDDDDLPGPSNAQTTTTYSTTTAAIYRTTSPELCTEDGELTNFADDPIDNWQSTVAAAADCMDTVATPTEIDSFDEPLFAHEEERPPIDNGQTTVADPDCRDTVAAPMEIDSFEEEPGPSTRPPPDFSLINRWLTEGTEQEGRKRTGGVSAAAVGWMMEGRGDEKGQLRSFGHYMKLKRDKLHHQVNVLGRLKHVSEIFKGISIFVNGYTEPPALELRSLIQSHGGEYHVYYEYGTTTYTIASEMATVKRSKARKDEVIVRPELIVDSVAAGRLLGHKPYLLLPDEEEMLRRRGGTISQAMKKLTEKAAEASGAVAPPTRQTALDARDAAFIDEYYARSRLHLISTLAQEMRDYVSTLRDTNASTEAARAEMNGRMRGRSQEEGETSGRSSIPLPSSEKAIMHIDLDCFFVSVTLR